MEDFIQNYIGQFEDKHDLPIHFVGSIAFYLKDELSELFERHKLKLGNVLRRPIDGLIAYHVTNK